MLGEALCLALHDAGWSADWVRDGEAALTALASDEHELVILDLGLPRATGLEVLRRVRDKRNQVPIVILTAKDGLSDRVDGLDAGADDYMVKPFEMAELLARLRAVLRRRSGAAEPILTNGTVALDPASHRATRGDIQCELTPREFSLLYALLRRPGMIMSRSQLEASIYSWNEPVESNTIDFLIHSVRRKLGPDVISNVRGAGWMVQRCG